jgi:NAD(P)-dependent dehydrogenase (short-subunit alcohol dehydrogenase family)
MVCVMRRSDAVHADEQEGIMQLKGRIALVTGASRGIGEAVARRLAAEGAMVVCTSRRQEAVDAVAASIRESGGAAIGRAVDVTDFAAVQGAVDAVVERHGRLDLLVNNAGVIDPIAHLHASDPTAWAHAIDVNVKGVYHGLRAALPVMVRQGSGVVVNMSSGAANSALEGWSPYCASKAAAQKLTAVAQEEVGVHGVRVVGLSPGTIRTAMMRRIKDSGMNAVSRLPWDGHAPVEWPARAVVFLAGPGGAPFAGQDFSIKTDEGRRLVGLIG